MQNKNEQENYFQSIHAPIFFHRRANECQCTDNDTLCNGVRRL